MNYKEGDWVLTCSLKPEQVKKIWFKNPTDYVRNSFSDSEWDVFSKDNFETESGNLHSFKHCSCKVISENYAKWFLGKQLFLKYPTQEEADLSEMSRVELYEQIIIEEAKKDNIVYEGI